MAGRDTHVGAKRARQLREELGLPPGAPIPCLLSLVEDDLGIPVSLSAMPEGVEGLCWRLADSPMLWVNAHEFVPRLRFTLAHELGHVRCGHDGSLILETYKTINGKRTTNAETQANAFAAELLAPTAGIREMLDGATPTLEDVVAIAASFGVSTTVAAYRCVTLRLVDSDARLKAEIDEGLHVPLWEALDPPPWTDALARLDPTTLPRLSPLLGDSALAALLRGDAAVEDIAANIGCDPEVLTSSLTLLGV